MTTIRDLSNWIRNYGQHARHLSHLMADRFVWHQLWTAMDVIDDVESALTTYLENEFPIDTGERYLRIYGAMQGLYLQQDALRDLIKAIDPAKKICLNDVLADIRDARNASVGHPTRQRIKGNALSAHSIVQNSITKEGFTLHSYPYKDGKFSRYIPVVELIKKQRAESIRILSEVVTDLREQEQAHRNEFQGARLMKTFDLVGYAFEKIFEEVRRDATPILGVWGTDHLQKSLDEFEKLLVERGLGIDTYDSIKDLYDEIKYPLGELTKVLHNESSEIRSANGAVVFAEALQGYFERLRHIAKEIDEEYASEPEPIVQAAGV